MSKDLESLEMLCWRRTGKIGPTDHVRNAVVIVHSQGEEEYPTDNKKKEC